MALDLSCQVEHSSAGPVLRRQTGPLPPAHRISSQPRKVSVQFPVASRPADVGQKSVFSPKDWRCQSVDQAEMNLIFSLSAPCLYSSAGRRCMQVPRSRECVWLSCARARPLIGRWQPAVSEQAKVGQADSLQNQLRLEQTSSQTFSLLACRHAGEVENFSISPFPLGTAICSTHSIHGTHTAHLHSLIPLACLVSACIGGFAWGSRPKALGIGCTRSYSVSHSDAFALHVTQPKCAHITRLHIRSMG